MANASKSVPDNNLVIFKILYEIEVGLREFIISLLSNSHGPTWWKERLPRDVLETYREGLKYDRSMKWNRHISHHPLYYIEFPDLKKIIDRNDNWNDVFRAIFKRKEQIISTLSELEPIRNTIAHNRKATAYDLGLAQQALNKLQQAIGKRQFGKLISRGTFAEDIPTVLSLLKVEGEDAFRECKALQPLLSLDIWARVEPTWWFDSDYLSRDVTFVRCYFEKLLSYQRIPRGRGTGHVIESWVKTQGLDNLFEKTIDTLTTILGDINER